MGLVSECPFFWRDDRNLFVGEREKERESEIDDGLVYLLLRSPKPGSQAQSHRGER